LSDVPPEAALSGETVVCISTIDWDFLWQGHQEIMSRLAQMGTRVVFIENIGGMRTIRASDAGRILRRLRHVLAKSSRSPTGPPDLTILAPILLPFPRSRLARSVNHLLIRRLARTVRRLSGSDPIVFTFLPSPEARELIADVRGQHSAIVYYCVADFPELAQDQSSLVASETALVRDADLVFVNSMRFSQRFTGLNSEVHYFPGGVNLDRFDPAAVQDIPRELRALPRPLIGYVGGLHQHLDTALLRRLARAEPSASIIVIGPVLADIGDLAAESNVHLLGPRPWLELPPFLAAFDVGLIPYVLSAYTATVYPTKLFEYLAMGRPVVSADLPEVRRLQLPEFAVRIAADHDSFVHAVRAALAETDVTAPERRRALAAEHDWGAIVRRMSDLMSAMARAKRAGQAS
jgi:glycosyltransferase involved in cell wall biosynthesis